MGKCTSLVRYVGAFAYFQRIFKISFSTCSIHFFSLVETFFSYVDVGHNLNLAHAGETSTYDDQSGMMGYSYSSDEGPVMCFNAPKTYQLGWFSNFHVDIELTTPISPWTWNGNLVGQAERDNANISQDDMMIVRIFGFGGTDYYVSYNRKTGINSGSQEGGNQVLIHSRENGIGYGTSTLLAKLNSGGAHTVSNYDGSDADL